MILITDLHVYEPNTRAHINRNFFDN